jgi:lysophospholipase L1-like esterase
VKKGRREEGMMKRAMGDWRSGWLTGLAGIGGGSSGDSSSEGKRRGERGAGG